MIGTMFLGGTARRKPSGARSEVSGACQDQHAGCPAPSLGWPGERKSSGHLATRNKPRKRGLGPGSQGLGAQGLGLGAQATRVAWAWTQVFRRSEKSQAGEGVGDG